MRSALDELGVAYIYVDIHADEPSRARVRAINHGCESVPTLVFPDGSTLTEPSIQVLRSKLAPKIAQPEARAAVNEGNSRLTTLRVVSAGVVSIAAGLILDIPLLELAGGLGILLWLGLKIRHS